jgi:hypothetical protein
VVDVPNGAQSASFVFVDNIYLFVLEHLRFIENGKK